ncbi:hypothetical protein DEO72_LG2g3273 [Vigna unguiculata]|uniref:Uncharacterized protein n=1 Tax=Vigna unguiculata TaxID=3917 RepID=A0A4D6L349_VIGUN|nr:hypothetical protein DEO72_LG2g3273 [Vigna unguiculata]
MLALVVDTSAHPRAMCYKCYNESIFPHHKAEGSRLGEEDLRSGELPSSRRELDFQYIGLAQVLAQARLSSPKRDVRSPKKKTQTHRHTPNNDPTMSYIHNSRQNSINHEQHKITDFTPNKQEGSSFPYLENKLAAGSLVGTTKKELNGTKVRVRTDLREVEVQLKFTWRGLTANPSRAQKRKGRQCLGSDCKSEAERETLATLGP